MNIIFQDKNLAVIDKPAGLLVHSTPGVDNKNTLVNLITNEWPQLRQNFVGQADPTRPGIVHRLDQDTSGLIIIAKNPKTLDFLQQQFKNHEIKKIYLALVLGKVNPEKGEIITQISRDKSGKHAKQKISSFSFSWEKSKSREAVTNYKVLNSYEFNKQILTLLELEIKTGRTHQIRAQLKHKNWPIVGDMLYNTKESKRISKTLNLNRQFLHSTHLEIKFPDNNLHKFDSQLPDDLQNILEEIK